MLTDESKEKMADVFSSLYYDNMSVNSLFIISDIPRNTVPAFAGMVIPIEYWKETIKVICSHSSAKEELTRLLDSANKRFTNKKLKLITEEVKKEMS